MAVTASQKAAGLWLLLDSGTRRKVFESLSPEEWERVQASLKSVQDLPGDDLRQIVLDICRDQSLAFEIARRGIEARFWRSDTSGKWRSLARSTINRFLRAVSPSIVFYRRMD